MLKLNEKFFIIKKTRIEAINDQKQFIHSFSIQNILNIYNIPDTLWAEYIVVKKIRMIPNLTELIYSIVGVTDFKQINYNYDKQYRIKIQCYCYDGI